MNKKFARLLFIVLLFACPFQIFAQQTLRIQVIQKSLDSLAKYVPGLNQKVFPGANNQALIPGICLIINIGFLDACFWNIGVSPDRGFSTKGKWAVLVN